jgi:GNAT superfamily N-acetyltransferase
MNFAITTEPQHLKDILTMSIRNDFYIDHIWLVITGKIYPAQIKKWEREGRSPAWIAGTTEAYMENLLNPLFGYKWFVFMNEENKVVGFVASSYRVDLENGKCFLEYMLIDEAYRGKGHSHQILNSFFEWCKTNNINQIKIQFEPEIQQLKHLYAKHGFKKMILERGDDRPSKYENWYKLL